MPAADHENGIFAACVDPYSANKPGAPATLNYFLLPIAIDGNFTCQREYAAPDCG